jgi:hypothetical protein
LDNSMQRPAGVDTIVLKGCTCECHMNALSVHKVALSALNATIASSASNPDVRKHQGPPWLT